MLTYNNKIIASKIIYCDSVVRKVTGLMFKTKTAVKNTAWLFRFKNSGRVSVTMFFVFFPIDVVFLDNSNKIIELKENFRPFTNYSSKKKISSFLELECGTIKKYGFKEGIKLNVS